VDTPTLLRLALVYAHLLLCVFALHEVLSADWKVLRRRIDAAALAGVERRLLVLLGGLWATGLSIIFIDCGTDLARIADNPKLLAKLATVCVLTLNGVVLRHFCFPRIAGAQTLGRLEAAAVMVFGAISTSSWLSAAFFGIARPLKQWHPGQTLGLYIAVLTASITVAIALGLALKQPLLRPALRQRRARPAPDEAQLQAQRAIA